MITSSPRFRVVLSAHKAALLELRYFWQMLLHAKVQFEGLTRATRKIDKAVKHADKVYR